MARTLSLGYSPCPNDTFIFYALAHGRIDAGGLLFEERLEDVETLNRMAFESSLDVTKISYNAFGNLRDEYCLLRAGGAIGRGCGPLVVAREKVTMDELRGRRIAIPGRNTTAFLLLQLFNPEFRENAVVMPFHEVMEAVREGDVDAGLIIHESRFTYPEYGLKQIVDLGEWWEGETGHPIPLGCIIARRSLGTDLTRAVDRIIGESVRYAFGHRDETNEYIKAHSHELKDDVINEHINLYVNEYTVDMGDDGVQAVQKLFGMAEDRGIVKKSSKPLFCSET
jgi:1,4-dihydroxy-6-naphthoate synthase